MIAISKTTDLDTLNRVITQFPNVREYPADIPEIKVAFTNEYNSELHSTKTFITMPDDAVIKKALMFVRVYYDIGSGSISAVQPDVVLESNNGMIYGAVLSDLYTGEPGPNDPFYDFEIDMGPTGDTPTLYRCLSPFLDQTAGSPLICEVSNYNYGGTMRKGVSFKTLQMDSNPDFDTLTPDDFAGLSIMGDDVYRDLAFWGKSGPNALNSDGKNADFICL